MKKYSIIHADPPWHYKTYSPKGNGRSAEKHYPTMSIAEIKALPVEKLAADDCALFMWITFPCMKEAFEVLEAWGFQYKTVAFVWVKQNRVSDGLLWGMGYWTRSNAEICVLATKGHPKRVSSGVHQVIMSHVQRHRKSQTKPESASCSLWAICPGLNCLHGRKRMDGMFGATRWNAIWNCNIPQS